MSSNTLNPRLNCLGCFFCLVFLCKINLTKGVQETYKNLINKEKALDYKTFDFIMVENRSFLYIIYLILKNIFFL